MLECSRQVLCQSIQLTVAYSTSFEVMMAQPAVTVAVLADRLGVSLPAAQTAVDQLVAAGILTAANRNRRNRVWVAGEVIDALDAFAMRSGRRRFAGH